MQKITVLIVLFIVLITSSLYSQEKEIPKPTLQKIEKYFKEKGEIYFKFKAYSGKELETITRIISIANVDGNTVYAYANKDEFLKFRKLGYGFELLPHPSDGAHVKMADNTEKMLSSLNSYPTYSQYVSIMNGFASQYPTLCRIVHAGNTVNHEILFAVLSKNVNSPEAEPKFMYTSTMHGNETVGYILMLKLIDTLLSGYSTNLQFSRLLDNMEIWINPLANPDGAYHGGDNTINGAIRGNANNIDVNRNFPDPLMGDHPDGYAWQPETIIFMNIATDNYFTMSANFHSGEEVVNYPWDHKKTPVTADNNWWVNVSRKYADTVHRYASVVNYNGTGTITTSSRSKDITGINTLFSSEMNQGDIIKTTAGVEIGVVNSVTSNTLMSLKQNAASDNTNIAYLYSYNNTG